LGWLVDQYQVSTNKASGIVNATNDWAREHDYPRYILELVLRIIELSVRTVEIVSGLPVLAI
jgi:predicted helicase